MIVYIYMEGGDSESLRAFRNEDEGRKWWTEETGREEGDIYEVELD